MRPNQGFCPPKLVGTTKRVHVVLRDGYDTRTRPTEKEGWAADGRGGCDWRLTGSPHDILEWELKA